jgi:hypothetical protein
MMNDAAPMTSTIRATAHFATLKLNRQFIALPTPQLWLSLRSMTESEYKRLENLKDWELFSYITEKEHSENRHVAEHILHLRRTDAARRAAERSARAALWSAAAAAISASAAVISLLCHGI